ncbi:hypothetical protein Ae201684P_010763 [Aphanomyces euteiches]|uniref:Uncharacterized protein n=1 Tax=Aphanomyces euteiches TaxID=100861 RepID=A0A6G0WPP2_9STRA|nr:hypothetical protein Ae201684_013070 [Aphanomyces euteiches]KAH9076832.1 hypothetical protein Ae201684P_010763 [Aphanomyces euteiches]
MQHEEAPREIAATSSSCDKVWWDKTNPCFDLPPIKRRLVFSCAGSEIKRKLVFTAHRVVKPRPTKRELQREAEAKLRDQGATNNTRPTDDVSTPYFSKLGRRKRQLVFD